MNWLIKWLVFLGGNICPTSGKRVSPVLKPTSRCHQLSNNEHNLLSSENKKCICGMSIPALGLSSSSSHQWQQRAAFRPSSSFSHPYRSFVQASWSQSAAIVLCPRGGADGRRPRRRLSGWLLSSFPAPFDLMSKKKWIRTLFLITLGCSMAFQLQWVKS